MIKSNSKKQTGKTLNSWANKLPTMKKIFSIFIVLLLVGCATETTPQTPEQKQEDIKIGAILFLTGNDYADVAKAFQEGIDLAVEEINAEGGVLGRKVSVIYEDTEWQVPKSVTAAQKLLNVDKVHIGMNGFINDAKAIGPLFNSAKTPLVMIWDAKVRNVGLENLPYVFGPGFSTPAAGQVMAEFAKEKGVKKLAVVYHPDEWAALISSSLADKFKELGGEVILNEQVDVSETDFKTVILKASKTDAIYFPMIANEDIFIKRAKELGYKGLLLSGDSTTDQVIANAGKAAEGMFFTQVSEPDTPQFMTFKDAYVKKYGKESGLLVFVGLGYDTTKLTAEAIKRAGSTDGTAIKDAMYEIKELDGALGSISIDDFGGAAKLEKVFTVKDGKQVLVE